MADRLKQIVETIEMMADVEITTPFTSHNGVVKGVVAVTVAARSEKFAVLIMAPYPQQFHESETIRFTGSGFLEFGHVNFDGSICVHTRHATDLRQKLHLDFTALKAWMQKYMINRHVDPHYEHIVVSPNLVGGRKTVMLFTEVDHTFKAGDFGTMKFSLLQHGKAKEIDISTYFLQSFQIDSKDIFCKWSGFYKSMDKFQGIYLFLDRPPVVHGRFAVKNWQDLLEYLPSGFFEHLQKTEYLLSDQDYKNLTLMLGYPIGNDEVHWQMITIEKNGFPNYRERLKGTRLYPWKLKDMPILWGETINSGYRYFFGRGALCEELAGKKILLIGIGALGSIVATTLCRGGCKDFTLIDYEAKEPGNVCRSEYNFYSGINNKVDELVKLLISISPFVEVRGDATIADGFKLILNDSTFKKEMRDYMNTFDLIIDCTADNDMASLLDHIGSDGDMLNLSITNHAKELVCVGGPNLYHNLMHIFSALESPDNTDLYNPTGCWSPTFKAGYNDIAVMAQFAIRQIDICYSEHKPVRNFYLSAQTENGFNILMHQF